MGVYDLEDDTGQITVLTNSGLPAVGTHLTVQAAVVDGITVGGTHYGTALREQSRTQRPAPE
jgi:hypothetical protein